jgi:hypothetical protein
LEEWTVEGDGWAGWERGVARQPHLLLVLQPGAGGAARGRQREGQLTAPVLDSQSERVKFRAQPIRAR